jgi:DNA-binding transcriptional MerR regulator
MQRVGTVNGLRIGELAERAGLTVRTLHHFDQIGLVRASERTEAGHRRYSEGEVRRLYQVVALRSLGVPFAGIAGALEGDGFTLKDAVAAQLEAVDAELLHARRLRRRLERTLEVLERSDDPSVEELTQIMEVMRMHETYYTPEELAQLEARREEVGEDQIAAIERE